MPFKLEGTKAMQNKIARIVKQFPSKVEQALFIEAELIMTKSKRDFVPVDLGPLRASGTVAKPVRRGKNISVTMSFGGPAAPYALAVHEHPSSSSPPSWEGVVVKFSPTGRGPKYLEKPFRAALRGMDKRIAKRVSP